MACGLSRHHLWLLFLLHIDRSLFDRSQLCVAHHLSCCYRSSRHWLLLWWKQLENYKLIFGTRDEESTKQARAGPAELNNIGESSRKRAVNSHQSKCIQTFVPSPHCRHRADVCNQWTAEERMCICVLGVMPIFHTCAHLAFSRTEVNLPQQSDDCVTVTEKLSVSGWRSVCVNTFFFYTEMLYLQHLPRPAAINPSPRLHYLCHYRATHQPQSWVANNRTNLYTLFQPCQKSKVLISYIWE